MTVQIIDEYEIRCTDKSCQKILRYTKNDIHSGHTSCMGREGSPYVGITCPACAQILREDELKKNAKKV